MTTDNPDALLHPVTDSQSDPFDPQYLRLSQDFASTVGVKKKLVTVPVRKPTRQEFVRVHPDPDYRLDTAVLELKAERETYLVGRDLWAEVPGEVVPKTIFTAMTRQNVLLLWPIRLPGEDGRHDEWNRSALETAERAKHRWVRVAANMHLGAYELFEAPADLPEPQWPEEKFNEILKIAFRDRFIQEISHPVLRRLRGEI
jgi:hypothetical protein